MPLVSPNNHGFGWIRDLPDGRDHQYQLNEPISVATALAKMAGLTLDELPPIWDQSQIGACTAHGALRAFLAEAIKQGLTLPMLSRLFEYFNSRDLEGNADFDAGAQVRDAIKALAQFGAPPEEDWPYNIDQFATKPPQAAYADAKKHMAFRYQSIRVGGPGAPIRTALSNKQAITFGFNVPQFFEDGTWDPASGQPLPLPGPDDQFIGGHCVAATYYNFSGTFISTPSTNRRVDPYFTIDNSWSEAWGMAGRFNMDYRWFDAFRGLASDLWVIQKVD